MGVEFAIERSVSRHAARLGWTVRKVQFIGRRGAPDRLFMRRGPSGPELIFIEFKRPGDGVLSEHQKRELRLLHDIGIEAHVIDNEEDGNAVFDAKA